MAALIARPFVDRNGLDAAVLSFRRIFDALEASEILRDPIVEAFPDLFERGADGTIDFVAELADLIRFEGARLAANGAGDRYRLVARPADRHGELVAAIADAGKIEVAFSHGWPILSVARCAATVVDADPAASGGAEP